MHDVGNMFFIWDWEYRRWIFGETLFDVLNKVRLGRRVHLQARLRVRSTVERLLIKYIHLLKESKVQTGSVFTDFSVQHKNYLQKIGLFADWRSSIQNSV